MTYTIQCYVKKIVLERNGMASLTIRPTGKSRIEDVDGCCLGWSLGNDPDTKWPFVRLFPVDVASELLKGVTCFVRFALLQSKLHGREIEIRMEEESNGDKTTVRICGVMIL